MRENRFKKSITRGEAQLGLWQAFAHPLTAELCASTGFDWLLFDGEHGPNTVQTLLAQLQAVSAYPVEPVARPPIGRPEIIKQYLDIGFRTLLVPMVNSAEEAREIVSATRFPPAGIRGVASAAVRASTFGAEANYLEHAHEQLCVLVQIETLEAFERIEEIADVEGVDGIFVGPADLSASMGYLGHALHPAAIEKVEAGIERIRKAGKPAGVFAFNTVDARDKMRAGASFVSVGTDVGLLAGACRRILAEIDSSHANS